MNPEDDPPRSRFVEAIEGACRFVDGWFTPRWRALLTWVIAAAVSAYVFDEWGQHTIWKISEYVTKNFLPPSLAMIRELWASAGNSAMLCWIQPVALRLGWWRSFLWLTMLGAGFFALQTQNFVIALMPFALPATLAGRRRRPWMVAVATLVVAAFLEYAHRYPSQGSFWLGWAVANFLFAVVLLYGTSLIERREGAEPR